MNKKKPRAQRSSNALLPDAPSPQPAEAVVTSAAPASPHPPRPSRTPVEDAVRTLVEPAVRELVRELMTDPLLVSQLNVTHVLGLSPRAHLENCRRADFAPCVLKVGKLRLVDASEYRSWLASVDRHIPTSSCYPATGADAVLAELGLRRRASHVIGGRTVSTKKD